MQLQIKVEEVNDIIVLATAKAVTQLRAEIDRLGIKHSSNGKSLKDITARYKKTEGMVNRISFKFKRSGVFVHKGARRGYGGRVGSQWRNAKGETVKTNIRSLGKMDTGKSVAKEWFNPVIENYVEELTRKLAVQFIEITYSNLKIKHSR